MKMGRRKVLKNGQKLNIYVDKVVKQRLFVLATEQQKSISQVVRELAMAAPVKEAA